ncbi:MAG: hypothetical protein AAGJ18_06555 [Bacteroidota bacterium]
MNLNLVFLSCFCCLLFCKSNESNEVQVNIPTAQSETAYIWQNLRDIAFFEQNNYQLSLPEGALIEALKQKSKAGTLSDDDYTQLEAFMIDSIYKASAYQAGFAKIEQEIDLLNKMIEQINPANFGWPFKKFDTYQVNLTLYGPGGSYNPDEGSLLIFTTPKGQFKNYENPANTIIHEIVHIGIENSIIGKYNVPHTLKERIVDTFVQLHFGQYLPHYRIQEMGENRSDKYLKKVGDFKNLDQIVEQILLKEE